MKKAKTNFEKNTSNDGETEATTAYNEAIKIAIENQDQGTVDLLTKLIKIEEDQEDGSVV